MNGIMIFFYSALLLLCTLLFIEGKKNEDKYTLIVSSLGIVFFGFTVGFYIGW